MRRTLLIGGGFLLVLVILFGIQRDAEAPPAPTAVDAVFRGISKNSSTLFIDGAAISVELALTDSEWALGLGGRESLAQDAGMLFVFSQADFHGIWMRGMRFPIDIVWLAPATTDAKCGPGDAKGYLCLVVVDVKANAAPESYPEAFYPQARALYVLEMNAGAARKSGVAVGAVLALQRP